MQGFVLTLIPRRGWRRHPEVSALRRGRRDSPDGGLRSAGRVHHGGLRRRSSSGSGPWSDPRGSPVLSGCAGGRGGARLPAGPSLGAARREPARLREARDAVRGVVGVLGVGSRAPMRTTICSQGWRGGRGEGTGAARADVWLKVGTSLWPAATYPLDAPRGASLNADEVPPEVRPVLHQGELLGGLSIEKRPGEPLMPTEDKLINDLASQAGLVLRNVTLIEELEGVASTPRLGPGRRASQDRARTCTTARSSSWSPSP